MNRTDDEAQHETLADWSADLSDALRHAGLEVGVEVDIDAILALAGDAAHTVLRPAAPLTTFLVGFAAGRAAAGGASPEAAVAQAITATQALLGEFGESDGPNAHPHAGGASVPPAPGQ